MKTIQTHTTRHTPGPWSADNWAPGFSVSAPKSYYTVCSLVDCNNAEANAKLIASAPRLESALAGLLEFAKGNRGSRSGNPYLVPEVLEALGALAQAQGLPDDYDSRMSVDTQAICEKK